MHKQMPMHLVGQAKAMQFRRVLAYAELMPLHRIRAESVLDVHFRDGSIIGLAAKGVIN